jgi:AcrR family transcriptional regulator
LDARIIRTTQALEQAVLAMAATMPASRISVSQLCSRARVTRRTFYNRFDTPVQVLAQVLRRDLAELAVDDSHRGTRSEESPEVLLRLANSAIVDHVLRYREVYRQALLASDAGVFEVLVDHFVDYSTAFIRRSSALTLPDAGIDLVAQFVSHGFAGAIKAWLRDPVITREVLEEAVAVVAPAWWK